VATGRQPQGLGVSPDSTSVYVAISVNNEVAQYDVGPAGGLSPKTPATIAAGSFPRAVAVSPQPVPISRAQCKHGGWHNFPRFKNQGQCIAFVNHHR
jgi:hypothetical protein